MDARRRQTLPGEAGFTILEVMVAALMLGIGLVGILAMQATATVTNRQAADMRGAMQIAQTTLERTKLDALEWTLASTPTSATTLGQVLTSMPVTEGSGARSDDYEPDEGWTLRNVFGVTASTNEMNIPYISDFTMANGERPRVMTTGSDYCVATRAWPVLTQQMVRVDVRVFWPKGTAGQAVMSGDCSWFTGSVNEDQFDRLFHSVRLTGAVRRNDAISAPVLPPAT